MDTQREREIIDALMAFSFKQLQDAMTILTYINRKGIAPDEIVEVIQKKIRVNNRKIKRAKYMTMRMFRESHNYARTMASLAEPVSIPKCTACGIHMQLNDNPDEGDSQWTCPRCRFGRYVHTPAREEMRRLHIEAQKRTDKQEKTNGQ